MKKDNLVCSNIIEKVACKAAFLILFIFFCEIWALAQETPRLPSGQEPGAQAERYKYDSERAKKYLEYKTPKAPKIEIEKEKVRPEIEGPSFILKEVNVTGSTEFKRQDFEFIYKPYIGKSVTFTDIETIANMIELEYKKKG